jgi:hypothetical protein
MVARSWMELLGIVVDGMLRFSDDERRRRWLGRHLECFNGPVDSHVPENQSSFDVYISSFLVDPRIT